MKKRILTVFALLCAVFCLGGCSGDTTESKIDIDSVVWVTETYSDRYHGDYYSIEIPTQWENAGNGVFRAYESSNIPGACTILYLRSYDSVEEYMDAYIGSLDSYTQFIEQEAMAIAGRRGYRFVTERTYEENGQETITRREVYTFQDEDLVYSITFDPSTDDQIKSHILNSIILL